MLEDKAQAVLLGMACGDALGAPIEGWTALQIAQKIGVWTEIQSPTDFEEEIRKNRSERSLNAIQRKIPVLRKPGLYTDDTQQALILADMLTVHHEVNLPYLAASYVKLASPFREGELGLFRGAGADFAETVHHLRMHIPYPRCGVVKAGNGAAMRIPPVGVFFRQDMDRLTTAVIDISQMTHLDIRAIAGAGLIAFCVGWLIPRAEFNPSNLVEDAYRFVWETEKRIKADYPCIDSAKPICHQLSQTILKLPAILELSEANQSSALDELIYSISSDGAAKHHSPFVLDAVIFSFFLLLRFGPNLEQAVITGVNHGGDTDTIGALTAALCAALGGMGSIPQHWLTMIPASEELKTRASALVDRASSSTLCSLYDREKQLCKLEDEYRAYFTDLLKKRYVF